MDGQISSKNKNTNENGGKKEHDWYWYKDPKGKLFWCNWGIARKVIQVPLQVRGFQTLYDSIDASLQSEFTASSSRGEQWITKVVQKMNHFFYQNSRNFRGGVPVRCYSSGATVIQSILKLIRLRCSTILQNFRILCWNIFWKKFICMHKCSIFYPCLDMAPRFEYKYEPP